MKRLLKYLGGTAAVLAAGCLCATASDTPDLSVIRQGDWYQHGDIWRNVDGGVTPLPHIQSKESATSTRESGPVATAPAKGGGLTAIVPSASSIPGMSVGSFLTPQERTHLSVRKTIRRLG